MSSAHLTLEGETAVGSASRHGHTPTPTTGPVSASVAGSRGSPSPGPWRPSSLAGRSSPALGQSSTFRDPVDHASGIHGGMTPLRGNGSASFSERQRAQPVTLSGTSNTGASSPGSVWTSPPKKTTLLSSGPAPTSSSYISLERNNGGEHHFTSTASIASPVLNSPNLFARTFLSTAPIPSAPPSVPVIDSSSNPNVHKQPLNMEALAAKFADSKETKEKFAKLQLPPALSSTNLIDKERRAPMGSFAAPSSASPHFAHIKVQRTASLNQGSQNSLLPKGSSNRLQPGNLAQSTDMRRTASHNNAFSSGLGMSMGASGGGLEYNNQGSGGLVSSSHNNGAVGGNSHLTPFSLSQLTRSSPRLSPLNPSDITTINQNDQVLPMQTPLLSSPNDKHLHPLQHSW
ncbi:hypothetical protein BGX27_011413 [Mortierella sp. AM989]|nr:hypothetical protein BGX27_011413 [Mortierella sp. AM989]